MDIVCYVITIVCVCEKWECVGGVRALGEHSYSNVLINVKMRQMVFTYMC